MSEKKKGKKEEREKKEERRDARFLLRRYEGKNVVNLSPSFIYWHFSGWGSSANSFPHQWEYTGAKLTSKTILSHPPALPMVPFHTNSNPIVGPFHRPALKFANHCANRSRLICYALEREWEAKQRNGLMKINSAKTEALGECFSFKRRFRNYGVGMHLPGKSGLRNEIVFEEEVEEELVEGVVEESNLEGFPSIFGGFLPKKKRGELVEAREEINWGVAPTTTSISKKRKRDNLEGVDGDTYKMAKHIRKGSGPRNEFVAAKEEVVDAKMKVEDIEPIPTKILRKRKLDDLEGPDEDAFRMVKFICR